MTKLAKFQKFAKELNSQQSVLRFQIVTEKNKPEASYLRFDWRDPAIEKITGQPARMSLDFKMEIAEQAKELNLDLFWLSESSRMIGSSK